jgi:hypothetical protein
MKEAIIAVVVGLLSGFLTNLVGVVMTGAWEPGVAGWVAAFFAAATFVVLRRRRSS